MKFASTLRDSCSLESVLHGLISVFEFFLGVPDGLEVVQSIFFLLFLVLLGLKMLGCDAFSVHLLLVDLDLPLDLSLCFFHVILLSQVKLDQRLLVLKLLAHGFNVLSFHGGSASRAHFIFALLLLCIFLGFLFTHLLA